MARYYGMHEGAEGGAAKLLGIIFILIGVYALLNFYGIFSIEAIKNNYVLIGAAIGSILGGLYMAGRSGKKYY